MKWFKHDATAAFDAKLARLRLKYGMEGYGLYWFCLESIARNVETHNLSFELEEDAELLAAATNIHYERVQEMMTYMVKLGLFENCEGHITCLKMATRTDEYTQKLLRSASTVPMLSRHTPDKVPPIRIEQNRTEQNRVDKLRVDKTFLPPTVKEVSDYTMTRPIKIDAEKFCDFYESKGWMVGKNRMRNWQAAVRNWEKGSNPTSKSQDWGI